MKETSFGPALGNIFYPPLKTIERILFLLKTRWTAKTATLAKTCTLRDMTAGFDEEPVSHKQGMCISRSIQIRTQALSFPSLFC